MGNVPFATLLRLRTCSRMWPPRPDGSSPLRAISCGGAPRDAIGRRGRPQLGDDFPELRSVWSARRIPQACARPPARRAVGRKDQVVDAATTCFECLRKRLASPRVIRKPSSVTTTSSRRAWGRARLRASATPRQCALTPKCTVGAALAMTTTPITAATLERAAIARAVAATVATANSADVIEIRLSTRRASNRASI